MTKQGEIIVSVKRAAKEKYAWPGGYPLFVVMHDCEALCCACAKRNLGQIAWATRSQLGDSWQAEGVEVNWEDGALYCAHCSQLIESAYV
jgi:hypothetical protein